MVKFYKISGLEKLAPFEKAVTDAKNGTFGTISDGVFAAAASATHFVYEVEKGDAYFCENMSEAVEKRVCSLEKIVGNELIIAPEHLVNPAGLAVGDGLSSNANGKLVKTSGGQLTITQITTFDGVNAVVAVVNEA